MESNNMDIKAFQNDLKDCSLSECCEKHNLSLSDAMDILIYKNRRKAMKKMREKRKERVNKYILFKRGRYCISRAGGDRDIIARFRTVEDARIVRDELIACDWDDSKLEEILEKNDIKQVPKFCVLANENAYIRCTKSGRYTITKCFKNGDGWKSKTFGTYNSLENAKKIRDELIDCEWDIEQLSAIRKRIWKESNE